MSSDNIASISKIAHIINKTKLDQFNLKYLNINSIRNKIFELENEINSSSKVIQFIALTETRIFPNETDLFNLPNYKSYFSCCQDGHRGAVLFVHESVDRSLVESNTQFKINYVIVKVPALKASIAVVYKKPTVFKDNFFSVLTHILNKTKKSYWLVTPILTSRGKVPKSLNIVLSSTHWAAASLITQTKNLQPELIST